MRDVAGGRKGVVYQNRIFQKGSNCFDLFPYTLDEKCIKRVTTQYLLDSPSGGC